MGEVYKARDTRLDRTVAIKILPAHLAADSQFRERFEREARTIAQLSHPNICTLHDVGRYDGIDFLVMEYLEGQTLAQRLLRGALPLDQALQIAVQIAEALDQAHRYRIVHRDLKPGNVMLTKAGAKLLDFGLAKAKNPVVTHSNLSVLPTTAPISAQGTILGTLQYMSPEQLEGKDADHRTDIFSFGAIVYESVTGRRAFGGDSSASVIAAILDREPALMSTIQPMSPPALERVVSKCLRKDPDDRWQTARDLHDEVKWIAEGPNVSAAVASERRSGARGALTFAAVGAAVLIAIVIGVASGMLDGRSMEAPTIRTSLLPPDGAQFGRGAAISPDGRWLAYVALSGGQNMLWVRPLNGMESRALEGTADASFPFWSPDSRSIGFFANAKLKTVEARGSPPTVLGDAYNGRGGTWAEDGTIIYSPGFNNPLHRVSAGSGATRLTALDTERGEMAHRWPWFLPDGRHFVFLVRSPRPEVQGIYVGSLDSSDRVRLIDADSNVQYAAPGYLLFMRGQTLMAQPFDVNALRARGEPTALAEGVRYVGSGVTRGDFGASDTGTLVYARGDNVGGNRIVWVDRSGKLIRQVTETPRTYNHITLSPDAHHIAVNVTAGSSITHLWVNKIPDSDVTPFTFGEVNDGVAIWSRSGSDLLWGSARPEVAFYKKAVNGSGSEQLIWRAPAGTAANGSQPTDWSPDGSHILFQMMGKNTGWDLWRLPLFGNREPQPFIQTPADDAQGQFSPDGRWVAYASNEPGQLQIFVQSVPPTGAKWQVSVAGGMLPMWRSDGRELFFLEPGTGRMMAADVVTDGTFQSRKPNLLFQLPVAPTHGSEAGNHYAVWPDGQRFVITLSMNESPIQSLNVIANWSTDLPR